MKESEKAAAEAAEIITRDILKLAAGVQSGTARNLVDAIVRAAVARVAESMAPVPEAAPTPIKQGSGNKLIPKDEATKLVMDSLASASVAQSKGPQKRFDTLSLKDRK